MAAAELALEQINKMVKTKRPFFSRNIIGLPSALTYNSKIHLDKLFGLEKRNCLKTQLLFLLLFLSASLNPAHCLAASTSNVQVIQLKTASGRTVDAEVSYPKYSKGLRPVVIFAHGGGCKDIDCRVGPTAYPFWKRLGEWFLQREFIVIRFYRGQTRTVRDDIELLLSAYGQAKHLMNTNPYKIGFFGHSEGTWQSVIATKEILSTGAPVGFVILNGTFIVDLEKHSKAQLREIFKPLTKFVHQRLSADNRKALKDYLGSWSVPNDLVSKLDKEWLTPADLDEVQNKFLEMMRAYIDRDKKLSSWKKIYPVETDFPSLRAVPVIVNQGTLDQETPFQEVRTYFCRHKTENIFLNKLNGLNHYFSEVKYNHQLPGRRWDPISMIYFRSLDRSLTLIGL